MSEGEWQTLACARRKSAEVSTRFFTSGSYTEVNGNTVWNLLVKSWRLGKCVRLREGKGRDKVKASRMRWVMGCFREEILL